VLAIIGGAAICSVTLYAVFYLPLHDGFPVNYGESPRIGDLLALASGLVAIVVGVLLSTGRPGSASARGVLLVAAGAPTLIVALLWAFPQTFHLSLFPVPFYFAYLYFTDLGVVHIGDGYVPLPLVAACAMVIAAGLVVLARPPVRAVSAAAPR
jgi:small basic protein